MRNRRGRSLARTSAWRALAVVSLVLAMACEDDGPGGRSVSAVVGPAGGTVVGPAGVVVDVPAGAVSSDFTLTVATVPSGTPPAGSALVAEPLRLTPKAQTFGVGVSITIPLAGPLPAGAAITDVVVLQGDLDRGMFAPLTTQPAGGSAVSVTVLSLGDFVATVPSADGGTTDTCLDMSGVWTIQEHCMPAYVGLTITMTQESSCVFGGADPVDATPFSVAVTGGTTVLVGGGCTGSVAGTSWSWDCSGCVQALTRP